MKTLSLPDALDFVQTFQAEFGENELLGLLEINIFWLIGEKELALNLFRQCVTEDVELAREIFEINPDLLNVPEFVHLTAQ